jgi:hypothetical protein
LREAEIEHLKLLIAKLRRLQFGCESEKLDREIEQLELRLDELQTAQAEQAVLSQTPVVVPSAVVKEKPARRPPLEHLARGTRKCTPKQAAYPDCGGKLQPLSEHVSEILEYMRKRHPKAVWTKCVYVGMMPEVGTCGSVHLGDRWTLRIRWLLGGSQHDGDGR